MGGESASAEADFFSCVRLGDMEGAADHLARETVDVDCTDSSSSGGGATALMVSAMCGHADMASMLLSVGAQVNLQDEVNGWTALMQAVFYAHRPVS